uniref:FH2 domain-containing protein n=1 Tax=Heterorhabditis bacteriophora TaxID=37862 RepID=A0A1I7XRN5_HETBA
MSCSNQEIVRPAQQSDLIEFVDSLTVEHKIQPSTKMKSGRKILEDASGVAELTKLIESFPKSVEEFVNIIEVAASFTNERENVRDFVRNV